LIAAKAQPIIPCMKIYTRTGDDGTTGLIGGRRVSKADARIDCYGTVDELNAAVGVAAVAAGPQLAAQLRAVQSDLFVLGSHLASPSNDSGAAASLPPLDESVADRLEAEIDAAEANLSPLRQFILPGGSEASARLHLARTVCRRAERLAVSLAAHAPVPAVAVRYLNRLSDWLFVMARRANRAAGVEDVPWVHQ
jgi:cob(I)alamin adenosyltransferase